MPGKGSSPRILDSNQWNPNRSQDPCPPWPPANTATWILASADVARSPIPHGPDGKQEAPGAEAEAEKPPGPKSAARRRRRLGGTGGSRSGRWRRDGLDGVGAGPSATVAGAPPSGAPPTRPSRGRRCWEPPSLPASCSSAAWLHPWQPAGTEHRDSTTIDLHSKSSGLNFSRFALAIPTPAGAGLGTAKLPRPMSVLWGGDGGDGRRGNSHHPLPVSTVPVHGPEPSYHSD